MHSRTRQVADPTSDGRVGRPLPTTEIPPASALASALAEVDACTRRFEDAIASGNVEAAAGAAVARAEALGALSADRWPEDCLPLLAEHLVQLIAQSRALAGAAADLRESTRSELRSNKNNTRLVRAYSV